MVVSSSPVVGITELVDRTDNEQVFEEFDGRWIVSSANDHPLAAVCQKCSDPSTVQSADSP